MTEQTKARESVIAKIKKLLSMTTDKGASEAEAEKAVQVASALLAEHNLTEADVLGSANTVFTIDKELVTESYPWKRQVAAMVAKLYFCTYFFHHEYERKTAKSRLRLDRHSFVGEPHNVEVAKMMFNYLSTTVERLAVTAAALQPVRGRDKYRRAFMWGCGGRLCYRIAMRIQQVRTQTTKTETGTTLPALASMYDRVAEQLERHLEDQGIGLKSAPDRGRANDEAAMLEGRKAAEGIGLDAQVTGRGNSHMLGQAVELKWQDPKGANQERRFMSASEARKYANEELLKKGSTNIWLSDSSGIVRLDA